MKTKLREKTVDEQAGFRTVQVKKSNIKCEHDHRKEQRTGKDNFLSFIEYTKAYDHILQKAMDDMLFLTHVLQILKALYRQQKAAVRTTYGLTSSLSTQKLF